MRLKVEISSKIKGIVVPIGFPIAAILIFASLVPEWEPREHWGYYSPIPCSRFFPRLLQSGR